MPDDHHPLMPRRNPEDIDFAAVKTDLEFIMERLSKLPSRRELIRFRILAALGLCVAALIGAHMWLRWVWACSLL